MIFQKNILHCNALKMSLPKKIPEPRQIRADDTRSVIRKCKTCDKREVSTASSWQVLRTGVVGRIFRKRRATWLNSNVFTPRKD